MITLYKVNGRLYESKEEAEKAEAKLKDEAARQKEWAKIIEAKKEYDKLLEAYVCKYKISGLGDLFESLLKS